MNKKYILNIQFYISILFIIIIVLLYFINFKSKNSKEYASKKIANNYNILKLYHNHLSSEELTYNTNSQKINIIGMIEIPKINVYYPIISESNDELLKIAPCRVSGPMPNENGNLCIAGHNYDNYKFFSKIIDLSKGDEIFIYNLDGNSLKYIIYEIYEVSSNDLSPLDIINKNQKQITLITCNNFNPTIRIIIKALSL